MANDGDAVRSLETNQGLVDYRFEFLEANLGLNTSSPSLAATALARLLEATVLATMPLALHLVQSERPWHRIGSWKFCLAVGETDTVAIRIDDCPQLKGCLFFGQDVQGQVHIGGRGLWGNAAKGGIGIIPQEQQMVRTRVSQQVGDDRAGGTMYGIHAHQHLIAGGKVCQQGIIVDTMLDTLAPDQLLPAGQGVFLHHPSVDCPVVPVNSAHWPKRARPGVYSSPGQCGDTGGEDFRGWPGIRGIVLEPGILHGIVAWGQVNGKGSPVDQQGGGKRASGGLSSAKFSLDWRPGRWPRPGPAWGRQSACQTEHAAPFLHFSEAADSQAGMQMRHRPRPLCTG